MYNVEQGKEIFEDEKHLREEIEYWFWAVREVMAVVGAVTDERLYREAVMCAVMRLEIGGPAPLAAKMMARLTGNDHIIKADVC
jgi:hypothetical protein